MREINKPKPVKLIAAVLYSPEIIPDSINQILIQHFGVIDEIISPFAFTFTDYYTQEMGSDLQKYFLSFETLIEPDRLPAIKLMTQEIEIKQLKQGNRQVNIDPGYIYAPKLVLATTKDYSHRIYLKNGIFGDVHLQFQQGQFVPNPWTYPDYKEPLVIDFLTRVRNRYMEQLAFVK